MKAARAERDELVQLTAPDDSDAEEKARLRARIGELEAKLAANWTPTHWTSRKGRKKKHGTHAGTTADRARKTDSYSPYDVDQLLARIDADRKKIAEVLEALKDLREPDGCDPDELMARVTAIIDKAEKPQ